MFFNLIKTRFEYVQFVMNTDIHDKRIIAISIFLVLYKQNWYPTHEYIRVWIKYEIIVMAWYYVIECATALNILFQLRAQFVTIRYGDIFIVLKRLLSLYSLF